VRSVPVKAKLSLHIASAVKSSLLGDDSTLMKWADTAGKSMNSGIEQFGRAQGRLGRVYMI
jgi:hypothetical protein